MKTPTILAALLLAFALCAPHAAAVGKLGDPAGPLSIAEWVKGGPVDLEKAKGKNIVVVEFWATWCGPCRESIPHLSELQKKYKDKGVIAVGVSSEDSDAIAPFVKDMGDKMDYVVARDDSEKTGSAYMKPYGQNGIPTAFIVDKQGLVVWFGHPMEPEFEKTLAKLVDGTFSLAESQKASDETKEKRAHFGAYFKLAVSGEDNAKADTEAKWLLDKGATDPDLLSHVALNILYAEDLKYRDKAFAMRAAKKANELTKGKDAIALHAYASALFDEGKVDDAIKYQKDAIKANTEDRLKDALAAALKKFEAAKAAPKK